MPNGRDHYKYDDFGNHKYADHDGTSDCKHGCGCWMGPTMSGSPIGVDPFGKCPMNVTKKILGFGKPLSKQDMIDDLVKSTIFTLERKVRHLHVYKVLVDASMPKSKFNLQKEIMDLTGIIGGLKGQILRINYNMEKVMESMPQNDI